MSKLIKYIRHYIVHFKNEDKFKPVEISEEGGKLLMQKLLTDDFIMVNWEFHNKYNINYIKPFDTDFAKYQKKQNIIKQQEERQKRFEAYKNN